jgi:hypothetical protein
MGYAQSTQSGGVKSSPGAKFSHSWSNKVIRTSSFCRVHLRAVSLHIYQLYQPTSVDTRRFVRALAALMSGEGLESTTTKRLEAALENVRYPVDFRLIHKELEATFRSTRLGCCDLSRQSEDSPRRIHHHLWLASVARGLYPSLLNLLYPQEGGPDWRGTQRCPIHL